MNTRHVKLIAKYSVRHSVRGGIGLVSLLLTLLFGLGEAHMMLQPAEMLVSQARQRGFENTSTEQVIQGLKDRRELRDLVGWVLGGSDPAKRQQVEAWTRHLLDDHPALLSAILLILLCGWPLVISMAAFNLFAGDIQTRGLRYHLIRADRSSIYWGRILGMLLTQFLILLFLLLTITAYMGFKLPFYGYGPLMLWGLYGALVLAMVSLPYVGLCAWISAGTSSPLVSLTLVSLILGCVPLIALIGKYKWEFLAYTNYLLPWGIQHRLFHPETTTVLFTAACCIGYAAVFFYLGWHKLQRRDL